MVFLRKIKDVWLKTGEYIGNIIANVVLALVFFLLIGIASLVTRIFQRKKESRAGVWKKRAHTEPTLQNLDHLF